MNIRERGHYIFILFLGLFLAPGYGGFRNNRSASVLSALEIKHIRSSGSPD